MRISPNSEPSVVGAYPAPAAASGPRLGRDKLTLATNETLDRALEQTPEVRADKVAEAKALLDNGTYPPAVIIRQISALLGAKITSAVQSD